MPRWDESLSPCGRIVANENALLLVSSQALVVSLLIPSCARAVTITAPKLAQEEPHDVSCDLFVRL